MSDMKQTYFQLFFALLLFFMCGIVSAQQYNFSQGYIFQQKYVQRINLAEGENLIGEAGGIEKFRTYDWLGHGDKSLPAGVRRSGDILEFKFKARPEISFRDFTYKGAGDGDSQGFIYLRSFSNYHLVGVYFGHDEPGFMLIEKSGSEVYFVDTH